MRGRLLAAALIVAIGIAAVALAFRRGDGSPLPSPRPDPAGSPAQVVAAFWSDARAGRVAAARALLVPELRSRLTAPVALAAHSVLARQLARVRVHTAAGIATVSFTPARAGLAPADGARVSVRLSRSGGRWLIASPPPGT